MSSYFAAINDSGTVTIDDDTQTLGVYREGAVRANISRGEVYGFLAGAGESVTFRPDGDTKFICSPPIVYGGSLLFFVATTDDVNIKYRTYKKVSLEQPKGNGVGLVLFDSQGRTVFDSSVRTWRHKGFYQSEFPYEGRGFETRDLVVWTTAWMHRVRMKLHLLNQDSRGNPVVRIGLTRESYMNPMSSPWFTETAPHFRADHAFSALGYIFSGDTLTTEQYFERWYFPQKVFGVGSVDILSSVNDLLLTQLGVFSFSYMFNIVE